MKFDGSDIGVPINKTAGRVVGKGIHYVPDKKIVIVHSENPLPTIPVSKNEIDLTGISFAKFKVIGKYKSHPKKGSTWVVKCVCSRYTVRKAKTINRPDPEDCCEECRQLLYLKRNNEFLRLGYNLEDKPKKGTK